MASEDQGGTKAPPINEEEIPEDGVVIENDEVVDFSDRERYVAMFDMLGYAKATNRLSLKQMVSATLRLQSMAKMTAAADMEFDEYGFAVPDPDSFRVGVLSFADTVLIHSLGNDIEDLLEVVLTSVQFTGLSIGAGLPVRGSITFGEFYVSNDRDLYTGEAMSRAHRLEGRQEWAGGVLDPKRIGTNEEEAKVVEHLLEEGVLFEYAAPMKSGPVETLCCLGWPYRNGMQIDYVRKSLSSLDPSSWGARRKVRNTLSFFRAYREAFPYVAPEVEEREDGTRVLMDDEDNVLYVWDDEDDGEE